jgi:uncharacterized protein YacL
MEERKLKKIEEKSLPWFYKLILKVPGTGFLENAGGVFWGILVPIFLVAEFFLSFYLVLFFPFPINLILTLVIPACVFVIFVKISLERFINWWNAMFGESFEWNVEKTLDEYINLLKTKRKKN